MRANFATDFTVADTFEEAETLSVPVPTTTAFVVASPMVISPLMIFFQLLRQLFSVSSAAKVVFEIRVATSSRD
jgi:hypothetical protein